VVSVSSGPPQSQRCWLITQRVITITNSTLLCWSRSACCRCLFYVQVRFTTAPLLTGIGIDSGCKLHQYVLNREPVHFKNSIFLVDRFHWQGHMGCPSGYSLDSYTSLDVTSINSQVNEQANAGLQRIKGRINWDARSSGS